MKLDIDFTQDPRYVPGFNGVGNIERFANYEDEDEVYPESEWKDRAAAIGPGEGLDELVTRIYDQKQEGSCVANATCQGIEIIQAKQFGRDRVVHLSAISLYKRIGSSAQSGAVVSDAWDAINAEGVLPLDDEANKARFKHTMPNTGYRTPYPPDWQQTARMFMGVEALAINNVASGVSASLKGHPIIVGRSGHSILYARLMLQDGKLVMKYPNSWSPEWNDHGYGYDSESMMRSAFRGAFALRAITVPTFQAA